jgi:putative flippase GtrA
VKSRTAILSGLCGVAGTAVDVVTLALLLELGVPVAVAAALGALAGAGLCFFANKYVAFRDAASLSVRQVGAFGLVAVGTALLMAIAMHATVVGLGISVLPAKAVCGAVLFFAWSLPAQRRFVFAAPPPLQLERDPATSYA